MLLRDGENYLGPAPAIDVPAHHGVTGKELVAIVTVRLSNGAGTFNETMLAEGILGENPVKIDFGSLESHPIPAHGGNFTFNAEQGDHLLFSFWERPAGQPSATGGWGGVEVSSKSPMSRGLVIDLLISERPYLIDPNSWTTWQVDHFSEAGAEAIVRTLDEYFLPDLASYWNSSVGYVASFC